MIAVFFDPEHLPSADVLAEHRRRHHLIVLVTEAPRSTAEHWAGEWQADALITADREHAARPDWQARAIAAFCRRYGVALESSHAYGVTLT